ncbi:MAG: 23S rRNA (pseudouridine(1915)-N(3))-methyltransferase RlmH [Firmicutes bacterium]|nr:23S rRNA (pseudouridine(1915)-N(3))-methyltransferase RlmH [Bacillota bacterium]
MIKIICFGKIKEEYLKNAIEDYQKRLCKYHKLEIIELKDDENIFKEEAQLIKMIDAKSYNILMDIKGTKVSSPKIAEIIDQVFSNYGTITLIIGGSNGVTDKIKELVNYRMSFGDITLPHGLFRVILLEQVYRAFKIINNERYHK